MIPRQSSELSVQGSVISSSSSSSSLVLKQGDEKPARNRRIRFALFIKVLFKLMDQKVVRDQAKSILHSCIKQARSGNRKYASLMEAIELPLRGLVGDQVWLCAYHYTELYHNRKRPSASNETRLSRAVKRMNLTKVKVEQEDSEATPTMELSADQSAWMDDVTEDSVDVQPTPWSELCRISSYSQLLPSSPLSSSFDIKAASVTAMPLPPLTLSKPKNHNNDYEYSDDEFNPTPWSELSQKPPLYEV